jgi:DMSO/TMAO reductase YedYZ heme-binding membrane subunit
MNLPKPRAVVYLFSLFLVSLVYVYVVIDYRSVGLQILRLAQIYGFISFFYILAALYISPIYSLIPELIGRNSIILARRAIGVSACLFALLHSYIAFFYILGGFIGLAYLSKDYVFSISLGLLSLIILCGLALASLDFMIRKMGKWWYRLHWLVYGLAGLILLHATMIGTHFQVFNDLLPSLVYLLTYVWLILEALRIDKTLNHKLGIPKKWGLFTIVTGIISIGLVFVLPQILTSENTFSVHSSHGAGSTSSLLYNSLNPQVKARIGNPNINFHSVLQASDDITANKPVDLGFRIFNDTLGQQIMQPDTSQINLFITDNSLSTGIVLQPRYEEGKYIFNYQFPRDNVYHLLLSFEPFQSMKQIFDFTIVAGKPQKIPNRDLNITPSLSKNNLSLTIGGELNIDSLSAGNTDFEFTSKNQNVKNLSNLKLTMINTQNFQFVHTLPMDSGDSQNTVIFKTFSLKTKLSPGVYKLFVTLVGESKSSSVLTIPVK